MILDTLKTIVLNFSYIFSIGNKTQASEPREVYTISRSAQIENETIGFMYVQPRKLEQAIYCGTPSIFSEARTQNPTFLNIRIFME